MRLVCKRSRISGAVSVPGSKSHTIRAVAVAAMAKGRSTLRSPLLSEDTVSAAGAATVFGAKVGRSDDDTVWSIDGVGGRLLRPVSTVDMGNSGTSLRIFTGIAALADFPASFDGDESLRTRPMESLLKALGMLGGKCSSAGGKCPLSVQGPMLGGKARIEGKSSQFVTGILFAAQVGRASCRGRW